jgi:hypothetical protein
MGWPVLVLVHILLLQLGQLSWPRDGWAELIFIYFFCLGWEIPEALVAKAFG